MNLAKFISTFSRQDLLVGLLVSSLLLTGTTGCSDDNPSNQNQGQGEVRMYMVDSPGDFDEVNVVVTEVSVHLTSNDSVSGWTVISNSTRTINLLDLTNGNSEIIGTKRLDPGMYSQIRLKIGTGSNVVVNGTTHPLEIPSGAQTGLKLNHHFEIAANVLYELTLDFDASRSIHLTGNDRYMMRPTIRVIANQVSGSISGVVSPASALAQASVMIGSDTISTYADAVSGGFKLMALPAGTYSVMIESGLDIYADSTVAGVNVTAMQNTNIGTIALRPR